MKIHRILAGAAGLAIAASAAFGASENLTNTRAEAYLQPGKHLFYVWCADGKDHVAYQKGSSGKDAQAKLTSVEKPAGCRAVWQGRISS